MVAGASVVDGTDEVLGDTGAWLAAVVGSAAEDVDEAVVEAGGMVAEVSLAGSPPVEQAATVIEATTSKDRRRTGWQGTAEREIVDGSLP